ncbi:bifunctional protein farnesyltransferase/protein geranylgeranyltransferase Ecym_3385 [Eremothecium cymbalariae DBVPG|uniref:Protein farnesyltransferase/geranylgeranyltransferase type-1 subunit alpha n=1 Tax=Eremothecium cymbalariae (strain CBS 270.75 / DBVPG 7215 / KCTC 17166 / NRRL Y-17582) TaxID=931890 RepID=G8JRV3_ERECY|nr:Hypothetical protein Ecym_3385 [Eremothecium cymbalariae DBVPG\
MVEPVAEQQKQARQGDGIDGEQNGGVVRMARFDYGDVVRIELETGPEHELCQIMYTEEYKELVGLLRGLMSVKEVSERALAVTTAMVEASPAYYTAWNYRYNIVKGLYEGDGEKLNEELDWLDEFTLNNTKNYQIWSYRQVLLKLHPVPQFAREQPVMQVVLADDTKNYHVWSYRRWVVLFFKEFSQELEFSSCLIDRDVYNNSAWSHRMFVLKNTETKVQVVDQEIEFAKSKISLAPQNVSSWNYLRGLYEQFKGGQCDETTLEFALSFVNGFFNCDDGTEFPEIQSSYALEMLAHEYAKNSETHNKAKLAFEGLSKAYDPIRSNYWLCQTNKLM